MVFLQFLGKKKFFLNFLDMDFFGPSKISEVFSKDFGNLSIGQEQKTSPTRKQFVEKEIQTDESLFSGGGRFVLILFF